MKYKLSKRELLKRGAVLFFAIIGLMSCRLKSKSKSKSKSNNADHSYDLLLRNSIWLPNWRMQKSLRSALEALSQGYVSTVSPFWYEIDNTGLLRPNPGSDGMSIPDKNSITQLRNKGALVTPTITTTLMPEQFIQLYGEQARQLSLAIIIKDEVIAHGYDGIDLNLENIALTTHIETAKKVREVYTSLCECVSSELMSVRKLLTITVMPRWSDKYEVWRDKLIPAIYDYKALSAAASILRIMAYDQHAPNTPPGPIAGFEWVTSICHWARNNVSITKSVEIGIPLYGRDWKMNKVKSVLFDNVTQLKKQYPESAVTYDINEKEETFSYVDAEGATHKVWYSNDQSVKDRLVLIQRYGFRGACFWAASFENPLLWKDLSEVIESR